jgi:hypothetical protein
LVGSFIFWFTHERNLNYWLEHFSEVTKGKVTKMRQKTGSRGSQWFYVEYQYSVIGSSKHIFREQQVNHDSYRLFSIGQPVIVCYYPANPILARLGGKDADKSAYNSARAIGCFFMVLGCFIVYPLFLYGERLYQEYRVLRLLGKSGQDTTAQIIKRENPTTRIYILVYEFKVNGQIITIKQQVGASTYQRMNEGDIAEICYLPTNLGTARLTGSYKDKAVYRYLVAITLLSVIPVVMTIGYPIWIAAQHR